MNNKPFTHIDLFAGIGGFRLALDRVGGSCCGFSEISKDAISSYCANFSEDPADNLGDITKIKELPPHDILTAGVPCQSWSIAGKNLGFDDDRGQLWNDTIYLLNQSRPEAFIFENVKGLADPRNRKALSYIMERIRQAGYHARHYLLNSSDYGVPQERVRVYIIGFKSEDAYNRFALPKPEKPHLKLADILQGIETSRGGSDLPPMTDLFGNPVQEKCRYRKLAGDFDYFLFNDIRNGATTIHSWDLIPTTERQQQLCYLLLRNRRKKNYGKLDGNPLSFEHFRQLDKTVKKEELDELVQKGILKKVPYRYMLTGNSGAIPDESEKLLLNHLEDGTLTLDSLKECREIKKSGAAISSLIISLVEKGLLVCDEERYEFRYTKISTGIEGVNRVFLPSSEVFPTLVASDTNDFVATVDIEASDESGLRKQFLEQIFFKGNYRKITKEEACQIQGFPKTFILPQSRSRWMRLIGNSVSVPVVEKLGKAILVAIRA